VIFQLIAQCSDAASEDLTHFVISSFIEMYLGLVICTNSIYYRKKQLTASLEGAKEVCKDKENNIWKYDKQTKKQKESILGKVVY